MKCRVCTQEINKNWSFTICKKCRSLPVDLQERFAQVNQFIEDMKNGVPLKVSPEIQALAEKISKEIKPGLPSDPETWAARLAEDLSRFTD